MHRNEVTNANIWFEFSFRRPVWCKLQGEESALCFVNLVSFFIAITTSLDLLFSRLTICFSLPLFQKVNSIHHTLQHFF